MISVAKKAKTKKNVSPRILEMRKKINDDEYLDNAIFRIALVLSKKIVENNDFQRK
ncbi:MAG: hypothetical protein GX220_03925 [Treponema sp.]|nr:hypothetical protein [Treponema sp.]